MDFPIEFEYEILSRAIKNVSFLRRAIKVCDAHHLSTIQLSWIWKQIKETWTLYKETCNSKILLAKANRDFIDESKRIPYILTIQKIDALEPTSPSIALEELTLYVREANLQIALEQSIKAFEKGKIDVAYDEIRKLLQNDVNKQINTDIKWIEEFQNRQQDRKLRNEHPELYPSVSTGIKSLDNIITGIQIGELGLVLGTTGKGKSVLLNNFAYHAIKNNVPTALISLEMPARQIAMRLDSIWLGIDYNKFKSYDFTDDELRFIDTQLAEAKELWKDKLRIISLPVRSSNMNDVRDALEDELVYNNFKPTLLLFDSLDHMNQIGKSEGHRLNQANVYWDSKRLAEEDGYAIWSTTQAAKEYVNKLATAESSSEAYDKSRIADIMITLNEYISTQTNETMIDFDEDEDFETNITPPVKGKLIELYLAKYRDGKSDVKIQLDAQFDKILMEEILSN